MIVYEFLYNSDTFESCAATISIHKTRKGAEMALEFHKNNIKKEFDELYSEFDFDFGMSWDIRETELQE